MSGDVMIIFRGNFQKDANIIDLNNFGEFKYQEHLKSLGREAGKFVYYTGSIGRWYHNDCIEYDTGYSLGIYLDFKHYRIIVKEWQGSAEDGYIAGRYEERR